MESVYKQKWDIGDTSKKVITIVVLTLALLIPLNMVENQIQTRKQFEETAQNTVASGWGKNVLFSTPIVFSQGSYVISKLSQTEVIVDSQEKKRGVFRVPVYTATMKSKITFAKPVTDQNTSVPKKVMADYLSVYVEPISSVQSFKIRDAKSGKELPAKISEFGIKIHAVIKINILYL